MSFAEVEALALLCHRAPDIPVPRVYNAYQIGNVSYIVMDYIPGPTIGKCWDKLSTAVKKSVVSQLRKHISSWQTIRGSYFGSVGGGPCEDSIFLHSYSGDRIAYGPFYSHQEFNKGVVADDDEDLEDLSW